MLNFFRIPENNIKAASYHSFLRHKIIYLMQKCITAIQNIEGIYLLNKWNY